MFRESEASENEGEPEGEFLVFQKQRGEMKDEKYSKNCKARY